MVGLGLAKRIVGPCLPGHAFLCAEGRFAGRHVPLIDILRDDGAVVRQDGTRVRKGAPSLRLVGRGLGAARTRPASFRRHNPCDADEHKRHAIVGKSFP
jgi:hypothetical protein